MRGWTADDEYLRDAAKIASLARRIGGYEELIRLDKQYRDLKIKHGSNCKIKIIKDSRGKFQCII